MRVKQCAYSVPARLIGAMVQVRISEAEVAVRHAGVEVARYVQQSRDEMEVLFTFLAERYEKKSVVITSNLVFSQWDQIFKDPMTTMAAIDRLVHHATILEFNGDSHRAHAAKAKAGA